MECKSDLRFKRKCDLELGTCFAFQPIPPLMPRHLAASPLRFRPLRAHCSPLLCIVCNSVFCTDLKHWKMVNKKSFERYIGSTACSDRQMSGPLQPKSSGPSDGPSCLFTWAGLIYPRPPRRRRSGSRFRSVCVTRTVAPNCWLLPIKKKKTVGCLTLCCFGPFIVVHRNV